MRSMLEVAVERGICIDRGDFVRARELSHILAECPEDAAKQLTEAEGKIEDLTAKLAVETTRVKIAHRNAEEKNP